MKILLTLVIALLLSTSAYSEQIALSDNNISYRGCLYPEISDQQVKFYRFPPHELHPKKFSDRPSYPIKSGLSGTGTSIVFKTDSPKVTLRFSYEGSQFASFAIHRNGVFSETIKLNSPSGTDLIIKNTSPGKVVEYQLTGPAAFPTYSLIGFKISDGYKLMPPSPIKDRVFVALGDSISHGLRKDNTNQTWPWLAAELLDMELYNIAVGGSNVNMGQVKPITKIPKIDIMTILWGYNDCINRGKSIEEYLQDMNNVLNEIRLRHPDTSIYLLNLLQSKMHKSKKTDFTLDDFRGALRQLYKNRKAAGDKNLYLISSETMTNKDDDLSDVVHLSHKGEAKLASAVAEFIKLSSHKPQ